ncbi:MAG: LytTR family DNA-binding domain-containing protein [Bacteroidota bacterium]
MDETKTYRVLVIDDEAPAREKILRFLDKLPQRFEGEEAGSAKEALAKFTAGFDFLFLDIQMPKQDGFSFLKEIGIENCPPIIFSTAYDQFALKAFEVHAVDYLLKPYEFDRFEQAVTEVLKRIAQPLPTQELLTDMLQSLKKEQGKQRLLWVNHRKKLIPVSVESILFIEADGNYVEIHTELGKKYLLRKALATLEEELDPSLFVRVHRSTLLNKLKITEMHPKSHGDLYAVLQNGNRVLVSRRYKQNLL